MSVSSDNTMKILRRNMYWETYLVIDHDSVVKQDRFFSKLDLDA